VSENAKINVATGFNGGVSVSLRADSAAEFEALLADAKSSGTLSALLAQLPASGITVDQAVQTVTQAFPGATVLPQPQSTVGQPLPQPQAQPAGGTPPGVNYPGDCPHGVRTYKDSIARGNPWRRWECAIPWSKDAAASRCKPVNV
jgi:hypothetical protein